MLLLKEDSKTNTTNKLSQYCTIIFILQDFAAFANVVSLGQKLFFFPPFICLSICFYSWTNLPKGSTSDREWSRWGWSFRMMWAVLKQWELDSSSRDGEDIQWSSGVVIQLTMNSSVTNVYQNIMVTQSVWLLKLA